MQTEIEAARRSSGAPRAQGRGRPHTGRGRAGEAVRLAVAAARTGEAIQVPRRLRLHEGVPGRALLTATPR
jgi:hypothetical protein